MYSHEHDAKVQRFSPSHNISAPLFIHFVNIFDVGQMKPHKPDTQMLRLRQFTAKTPAVTLQKTSSHRDL